MTIHPPQRTNLKPTVTPLIIIFLMCRLAGAALSLQAQTTPVSKPLVAIVHIDLDSTKVSEGLSILDQYAADCRKDAGNVSFTLLQEVSRDNHLTLVETWRDQAAFKMHADSSYTKRFRKDIQSYLGSPFDERLHHPI